MHVSSTSRRYGRALARVAIERRSEKTVAAELQGLLTFLRETPRVRLILESPASTDAQQVAVLDAIDAALGKDHALTPYTRNLLRVLVENGRFELFGEIVEAYRREMDKYNNLVVVEVTTAEELSADQRRDLEGALRRSLAGGGDIRLEPDPPRVDPSLLGGFVARVGSTAWDASLAKQLEQVKQQLVSE